MDVAVVGAGRVGTALAVLLARAGHRIVAASGGEATRARVERFLPGTPLLDPPEAARRGEVALLAVPDDRIVEVGDRIAAEAGFRRGQRVAHLSGSVPLLALGPARAAGATVLSAHPLQTFPDVEAGIDRLPGAAVAVTAWDEDGAAAGEQLARDVGARSFRVDEELKPLYHAAAVFCSNYLVAVEGMAELLFRRAGIPEPVPLFAPLARATMENVVRLGPGAALTGPVARGDAGTVRRNLEALERHAPDAVPIYVALARAAAEVGRVSPGQRRAIEEVLSRWT
jgi:predicted short-subunit dehydrogenase-like oxidoreductase (DUF2520 family)